MSKALAVAMLTVAIVAPTAGTARPLTTATGCAVLVPESTGGSNCRYVATGPGTYTVASPIAYWRISAFREGRFWVLLAGQRPVVDERLTPGVPPVFTPVQGTIDSRPGDIVDVSMWLQRVCAGPMCNNARAGYMEAGNAS